MSIRHKLNTAKNGSQVKGHALMAKIRYAKDTRHMIICDTSINGAAIPSSNDIFVASKSFSSKSEKSTFRDVASRDRESKSNSSSTSVFAEAIALIEKTIIKIRLCRHYKDSLQ